MTCKAPIRRVVGSWRIVEVGSALAAAEVAAATAEEIAAGMRGEGIVEADAFSG